MSKKALGVVFTIGGVALTGVGIYLATRKRSTAELGSALPAKKPPLIEQVTNAHGATTKVYAKKKIPIEQRVSLVQEHVANAVKDPEMRKLALAITGKGGTVSFGTRTIRVKGANCPPRDGKCELKAIYNWKRENIRYTGDIGPHKLSGVAGAPVEPVDLFQSPQKTIEYGGGDCDDHVAVGSSLTVLNGMPARLVVSSANPHPTDEDYGHIWEEGFIGSPKAGRPEWIPIDTGNDIPYDFFGKRAPHAKRREFPA